MGAALAELPQMIHVMLLPRSSMPPGSPGVHVSLDPSVKCGIAGTHLTVTVNGTEEKEGGHSHHDHQHDHASEQYRSMTIAMTTLMSTATPTTIITITPTVASTISIISSTT